MSGSILSQGRVEVVVPAAASIAIYTAGTANVFQRISAPNQPSQISPLGQVTAGQKILGPYAAGAIIILEAQHQPVEYSIGVAPGCPSSIKILSQPAPGTLNATGALTAALITTGIVTSTTAAATVATVPTGAVMDAAIDLAINDSFDWSVVNTGPSAFTVTAAAGHTLVGTAAVATLTSGRFRTCRTAVQTYVTYRLS